jgi:DNA-directed RNA polymerase subunit RPC12/RpoP
MDSIIVLIKSDGGFKMKLVEYHCPNCTATLQVDAEKHEAVCEYCGSKFQVYDEATAQQEKAYNFEVGRMKAREEYGYDNASFSGSQRKNSMLWLWVLGWIFCFPIPLTVLIVKTKKLKTPVKVALIAALWIFVFIVGATSEDTQGTSAQIMNTFIFFGLF